MGGNTGAEAVAGAHSDAFLSPRPRHHRCYCCFTDPRPLALQGTLGSIMQVVAGEDLSPAIVTVGEVVAASFARRRKGAAGDGAGVVGSVAAGAAGAGGAMGRGEYPDK